MLNAPDVDKSFSLYCDARYVGSGAILDQDNVDHLGIFYSRKLSSTQENFFTVEIREVLALILSLKHFEVYLRKVVIL